MLKEAKQTSAWIGVHDIFREGEWVTVKDTPFNGTKYTKWNQNSFKNPQPDNGGPKSKKPQNCVDMYKDGTLDDNQCDFPQPFLCEVWITTC